MAATTGILNPFNLTNQNEAETRIDAYAREVYLSDAPLLLALPSSPAPAENWTVTGHTIRPQTLTLNGAILAGGTTLTVTDATSTQVGDVLEMFATGGASTDRMLVTAVPSSTTLTVVRGFESTTAVANDNTGNKTIRLIGTASTGSEIDKTSFRNQPTTYTQRLQTYMYRASVGGLANYMPNTKLPNGFTDVFDHATRTKIIECLKDAQTGAYYGLGQTRDSATQRPTMLGIKAIINSYSSGANVTTSTAASFTQQNFVTDLIQKAVDGGGNPDLVVCSTSWLSGWSQWSSSKQYFTTQEMSQTLGIPVTRMFFSFGGKMLEIMYDYNLRSGTAVVLTKSDVMAKEGRPLFLKPVGSKGDATETDIIVDWSIEVGHPGWHAWREGVTGFA